MENLSGLKNNHYYTQDHEWVNFLGSVAYVGVCAFKLTGIRQIREIEFGRSGEFIKAGELLAIVYSGDYKIPVHMPVDGEVIRYNEELQDDKGGSLLQNSEQQGWVALIYPSSLHDRKDLLLPEQYQIVNKSLL